MTTQTMVPIPEDLAQHLTPELVAAFKRAGQSLGYRNLARSIASARPPKSHVTPRKEPMPVTARPTSNGAERRPQAQRSRGYPKPSRPRNAKGGFKVANPGSGERWVKNAGDSRIVYKHGAWCRANCHCRRSFVVDIKNGVYPEDWTERMGRLERRDVPQPFTPRTAGREVIQTEAAGS